MAAKIVARIVIVLSVSCALTLGTAAAYGQCAMCAEAVGDSVRTDGGSLAAGFYWSILFLLGMLGTVGTGLTMFIVRTAKAESAAALMAAGRAEEVRGDGGSSGAGV